MTSGAFDDELLDACRDAQACAVFFEVARQLGADPPFSTSSPAPKSRPSSALRDCPPHRGRPARESGARRSAKPVTWRYRFSGRP